MITEEMRKQLEKIILPEIQRNHFPGILIGVSKNGRESSVMFGETDPYTKEKPRRDTIYRLYSMSKPVCAAAAWILIEQGRMHLDDPVSEYLPEFKAIRRYTDDFEETVPVQKELKIRHLLHMTAGLTYNDDDKPGVNMGKLFDKIHADIRQGGQITTRDVSKMIADSPLAFEPGKQWRYGVCADVMGTVIEVVSGKTLGEFYREKLFEPLGMFDTGFYVPKEKQNRFAPLFRQVIENDECRLVYDTEYHLGLGDFLSPPAFESAGAGLVSTYEDSMKFAQMLANGGERQGVRILKQESVEEFAKNQLTEQQLKTMYFEHLRGYGYGNYMRVCMEEHKADMVPAPKGSFGWDGWCGPFLSVHTQKRETVVYMLQISAYSNWLNSSKILEILK